jgi:hypothetical protein
VQQLRETMQLEVFMEPVKDVTAAGPARKTFPRGHRVLAVKEELAADGKSSSHPRGVKHMTTRKMQIPIHWPKRAEGGRGLSFSLNQSSLP